MFGKVEVQERVWRSSARSYQRVFCALIGVRARGKSRALKRVLSDFGAEHAIAQAAVRVKEHYGFELHGSAVRSATLETAARAQRKLETKYAGAYRVLPAIGQERVVAEADGTMICTVRPGRRRGKRPREWKEMRLAAGPSAALPPPSSQSWRVITNSRYPTRGSSREQRLPLLEQPP